MVKVNNLIWDDWNRDHITRHNVTQVEIEEVCLGKYKSMESFRKRIVLKGKTKMGRKLTVVISPEDINLKTYTEGTYYPITAFEDLES